MVMRVPTHSSVDSLERHYRALSERWPVSHSGDYELLVTPNGNNDAPVHRWFHMKEAFSKDLLRRVVKDLALADRSKLRVLDPFVGSGTSAV
jgi:hypothetical protein